MSKLLHRPFKAFTIYALIILACSIPVYYLTIDYIWLKELDEHNLIIKERIEDRLNKINIDENELTSILKIWNVLQPGTQLRECDASATKKDSIYVTIKTNEYADIHETDRFRGLSSYLNINGHAYHLTIETNVEEADETMLAIAIVTFTFFVLLVAGFIILNKQIAKNIWKPFQNTLNQLKKFDLAKSKSLNLAPSGIEEFEELNHVLQRLITKNISVYNQQKIFIENASHELQTPLAVLKSKLEILLQSEHITKEQSEILNALELPLSRISRINKNLLVLAKIENSQFSETDNHDLSNMLAESIELLTDYFEAKKLAFALVLHQLFFINCNKFLLETLLQNLLTNAIRHTPKNGLVDITFEERTLYISNTGGSPLNKEKIFERFVVSSSESTNSGLGLAIVREICNRYQWSISYSFENNLHCFAVTF